MAIGRLERFVGDNAHRPVIAPPRFAKPLGRVAVVGSGPSGLAVAADLTKFGAQVTVYEALHVVGGVLQYGIPAFRLPREIIAREVDTLKSMGVCFETNKVIGKTFSVPQLLGGMGFDAVFVGAGAGAPAFLGIPGEFAGQVYSANEFLTRVNLMGGDRFPYLDTPISHSKSVIVIGAGNTAMDCLRVAKRLGTPTVRCVYRRSEAEAPARIEELRHAKEEGIEFFFLHGPVEIRTDTDGNVCGMKVQKMALGEPDEKGRRTPMPTREFVDLDADTVIYALGTKANPIVTQSTPGLKLNKWGYIVADDATQATSVPGMFAGGDIVTGGATVILAMGAGRRAARAIGAYLAGGKSKWPVTQEDVDAFTPPTPLAGEAAKAKPIAAPGLAVTAGRVKGEGPADEQGEHDVFRDAATMLQWRCTGCGKVSEGFAYPYGMCPYCGGKLEALEARRIERAAEVDAVRKAFEIELGGQAFYRKAAEQASDPDLQRLFASFAEMEKEHMDTLCRRYHLQVPGPSEGFQIERAAIYAGVENHPEDPANLFRIAIAFEQRAVDFFAGQADKVAADSAEAQLYKELAAEEREHVEHLKTEYRRWQSGKVGML